MYIFDLDGTITDTNGLWREVDAEFLGSRGFASTPEYEQAVVCSIFPAAAQYTKELFGLPDTVEEIMAEWERLAERHYRELAPLKPGAEAFLRQCRREGRPMVLFTACRPALCQAVLDRFRLRPLFDQIVFAEELGLEKRAPQCFVRLSERIGAPLKDCVLFDDGVENCATAARAGMMTVGVYDEYNEHRQDELRAVCTRTIRSFEELLTGGGEGGNS